MCPLGSANGQHACAWCPRLPAFDSIITTGASRAGPSSPGARKAGPSRSPKSQCAPVMAFSLLVLRFVVALQGGAAPYPSSPVLRHADDRRMPAASRRGGKGRAVPRPRIRRPRGGRRRARDVRARTARVRRCGGESVEGHGRWEVAHDGGRPDGRACDHLALLAAPPDAVTSPPDGRTPFGCEECLSRGAPWVRLRRCVTCGYVGCCDSSKGRHAFAHHVATGHPVVLSLAPDEDWAWCFRDEAFLVRAPGAPLDGSR
ncbi:UBP-type zinc finger domain-containing protein [Streptomyces wedmorensis]